MPTSRYTNGIRAIMPGFAATPNNIKVAAPSPICFLTASLGKGSMVSVESFMVERPSLAVLEGDENSSGRSDVCFELAIRFTFFLEWREGKSSRSVVIPFSPNF